MLYGYKKRCPIFLQIQTNLIKVGQKKIINEVPRRTYKSSAVSDLLNKERDVRAFMGHISAENSRGWNMNLLASQLWCWAALPDLDTPPQVLCTRETCSRRKPYTCRCYCANNFKHRTCEMHEIISFSYLIPTYQYQGSKSSCATGIVIYSFFRHLNF